MRIPIFDFAKITGLLTLISVVFFGCFPEKERLVEITSPGGAVQVHFHLKKGEPLYSVKRNNALLIGDSRMGFELKDIPPLNGNFEVTSAKYTSLDETWTQPWGEVKNVRNNYNSCLISLEEKSGDKRKLSIEFRVFDDGIGFRYIIPKQKNLDRFIITDEQTEFALAHDFNAWWIPAYRKDTDIEMDSEYLFRKDSVGALKEKVHTPLTLQSGDSLFISIHEAALMDYAAMTLFNKGNRVLKADLIPWSNGNRVEATSPMKTPWRTIQIGSKAGDLVTSYLILNLNEPNKLGDVSWVKPGKYDGMWWGMHMNMYTWSQGPKHGATTKNVKELIDFASKHKLSAVLAEGWNEGWDGDWVASGNFNFLKAYPDFDLKEISNYAKQKNIGLIAHHETGGNVANYEEQLDDALQLCEKYGIQRLKTGYVNKKPGGEFHQGQFMARHYQRVLETAARHHVMLDVHEPIKDTGLRRTYPNMMAREGARGTEYEAWSIGNPPSHTATLPFTRCLAGPLDYTPGIFNIQFDKNSKFRVHTTLAKQLALYVVIYSPMQMAADMPKNYEGNPAFKFIEDVPADWEETKVVDGKIGEFITTVRKDRNSQDWYLGSITNEEPRTQEVKLSFLTPGKKYKAEIYRDGATAHVDTNPMPIEILTEEVDAKSTLTLKLAPGGGTAIRFTEANKSLTMK